jgi:taurine transport system ATP-binding protein
MPSPASDTTVARVSPRPGSPAHGAPVTFQSVSQVFGKGRDRRQAIADVSLGVKPGEFVCIVGPSGCGKSTLLNLVAGFQRPSAGIVTVDGIAVDRPGADRGMVFQQHRLFPWMSVRENVEFGPKMAGVGSRQRRAASTQILEMVGLHDVRDRAPYELSGGMQQRAAIARALAARPRVLLMDEPFAALDAMTRERLQEEIVRIWRSTGTTILFVTHSVDEAAFVGSRVVGMSAHPGTIRLDEPVPFADADKTHLRSTLAFVEFRDRLSGIVRDAVG